MATSVSDAEHRFDQIMIGVGSLAVLSGLVLILTPPWVPIHLLGALTAVGGALLLGSGLLDRGSRWGARATLLVVIEVVAAIVAVSLILVLHVLPL